MCRRSAAPASQQADSGYFKGDDDLMVDRLVAACSAQKKALPELLPGYGRDLTPYFNPGSEGSEEDINTDFASDTSASAPPSPQSLSLSFVPMSKTTPSQAQPTAPHAKRGRNSRKKLEYGTKASDSDSGSDSAGSRRAHSKPKKTVQEPCFKGQIAQPPSDFLTLAASTVSEEQRQRVAQAFAQAANAANKPAKASKKHDRSSNDILTLTASSVSEEQRQQVAQAFALSAAASKRGAQKQEKRQQQRPSNDSTRSAPSSGDASQKWAGGAFANVPDPTNIPLPSMLLSATCTPSSSTSSLPGLQDQEVSSTLDGPVDPIKSSSLLAMLNSNGTGLHAVVPSHCGQTTPTPQSIVDAAASQALRQLLNF